MSKPSLVVVWGNCQAAPLADLVRGPFARAGLEVVPTPPVFLATRDDLDEVHRLVREAAFLVSQPIREEYRFGGCGTAALAARLPSGGRLVTVPTTFHTGPFPYLVNAHRADGARVDAPLVDYHDLRTVVAASRDMTVEATLASWPTPTRQAVQAENATSLERLREREADLDVRVSDLVGEPSSMWSMNHPTNGVLARIAARILEAANLSASLTPPSREYLGERRAPVEVAVAEALDWPASAVRPEWTVRDETLRQSDVLAAHLAFYARRPDVVADTLVRYAARITALTGAADAIPDL